MSIESRCFGVVALAVVMCSGSATGQAPTVGVQFQFQDTEYVQAFRLLQDRRRAEDSATAVLVAALQKHFTFLGFSSASVDSTARQVLVITLDQKDRGPSDPSAELGLHILLRNPPREPISVYWTWLRRAGTDRERRVTLPGFLVELRTRLRDLDGTYWERLVKELLSSISIADTAVTVWGSPPAWFMPYTMDDFCIDIESGRVRVANEQLTAFGPKPRTVIASVGVFDPPDTTAFPPPIVARYKQHLHAQPENPVGVPPADSLRVRGLYVVAYKQAPENCQNQAIPPGPGAVP